MNVRNYAAIDCGTNSTRMLIANKFETLDRQMKITRLGQGLDQSGELSNQAMSRVIDVLKDFRRSLDKHEVSEVRMVATSAARDASNSEDFFNKVESTLGVRPELLTGEEEGRLSFQGAIAELDPSQGPFLILDIGGGSTEFVFGSEKAENVYSSQIGCVRLTEEFFENDPPLPEELHACLSVVGGHVDDALREIPNIGDEVTLVGLAGTVSCIAAIEIGLEKYDREKIHHFHLSKDAVEDVFRTLATENKLERMSNPGLEEDRADVIVAGTAILVKVMRQLQLTECLVSESDIMDGILHSMLRDRNK
jgi:exopolyphosphatase/guanosine-5'-triphosphate,3'-diphosphate pyrophosphatase|tara:strand:+ start:698 stop:1621 length:924 start_codon:yes stop_codon:yes gene_type:complete